MTLDTSGNLYSTTEVGGAHGDGTIFEIVNGTTAISTLMSFNGANGAEILAGLTLDTSGNLFGTAYEGSGATNYGGVFELTPTPPSLSIYRAAGVNDRRDRAQRIGGECRSPYFIPGATCWPPILRTSRLL